MPLNVSERQASKMVSRDTCPRPTTQEIADGTGTFAVDNCGRRVRVPYHGKIRSVQPPPAMRRRRVEHYGSTVFASHGRHYHFARSLALIDCHSLGIYAVILLSLLTFSVKMTVSPLARSRGRRLFRGRRLSTRRGAARSVDPCRF